MDLILSIGFLLLGILPLRLQIEGNVDIPLDPSQSYAFALGWTAWYVQKKQEMIHNNRSYRSLYTTSFIIDLLLVSSLKRYVAKAGYDQDVSTSSIEPYVTGNEEAPATANASPPSPQLLSEHPSNGGEARCARDGPASARATSTGYVPSNPAEDSRALGTVNRSLSTRYEMSP
jgi:hypothetical protein